MKFPKLLLVVAVLVLSVMESVAQISAQQGENAGAQARIVSETEMNDLKNKAYSLLTTKSYRVKEQLEEVQTNSVASWKKSWSNSGEYLDAETRRIISVGPSEEEHKKREIVFKDKRKFVKYDDEPWKEIILDGKEDFSDAWQKNDAFYSRHPGIKSTYTYKGKALVNNVSTDLYEGIRTFNNPGFSKEGKPIEIKSTVTEQFWIDRSGRFVKQELEQKDANLRFRIYMVREIEYDISIKIEAPIK